MRTLQDHNDLWNAYEHLPAVLSSEMVLNEIGQYIGDDKLREFVDDVIRLWDLQDEFRDFSEYEE